MARDRLAAMRAQKQGGGSPSSRGNEGIASGSQSRSPDPDTQQDGRYEMTDLSQGAHAEGVTGDDMIAFYSEVTFIQDSLRTFRDNIRRISDLHSQSLGNMDETAIQSNENQLRELVENTSELSRELKVRIQNLQKKSGGGRDGQIRKQQTGLVKQKFVEAIQNYQQVEQQYRSKYKQRMERQFKIVKPDATPEEIRAVVDEDQGGQIFTQALRSSQHYGETRAAYREVQERHEDVKRIERTLDELGQLFNDMSILVEQQDETVNIIQTAAVNIEKDTETGLRHTDKAVASARSARRKRWICFIIILIILAIVAIALGVHFGTTKH